MTRKYPDTLQAALLFSHTCPMQFANLNWPDLRESLNAQLADEADLPPIDSFSENMPGQSVTMSNGAFHIVISGHADMLGAEKYASVLRSPFYVKMQPALIEAVKSHETHILIEVGLGAAPSIDEDHDPTVGPVTEEDQPLFEARLRLTKIIAALINQASPGGTLYWGQSDQIYTSAAFATITEHRFPLSLFVHPLFHASGATKKGQVLAGLKGLGSQHVLGTPVVFAEHAQPMMQSYERLLEFVAHCRSIGHTLQDGARFGSERSELLTVRHHPATSKNPAGCIELILDDPEKPNPRSNKIEQDEGAVLRNAFLGRTDAPSRTGKWTMSNPISALLRRIKALSNLTLRPTSKTRVKSN